MTVLCFGDSNTYGFDPRSFFGGRYEADERWCGLLAEQTGWQVVNCGTNGRCVPRTEQELVFLQRKMEENAPVDLLCIMLGSNDVLLGALPDAEEIAGRMDRLLTQLQQLAPETRLVLLAPPPVLLPDPEPASLLRQLGGLYRGLAEAHDILFCDPAEWNLPLACDGVHFLPRGHRIFAERFGAFLRKNR